MNPVVYVVTGASGAPKVFWGLEDAKKFAEEYVTEQEANYIEADKGFEWEWSTTGRYFLSWHHTLYGLGMDLDIDLYEVEIV